MTECHFCEYSGELEGHHVIPDRFGGPDDSSNIVDVCETCHDKLENLYDSSFYRWFGISDDNGVRWAFKPCSFDCDEQSDRLAVLSGRAVDEAGSAMAVPRHLQQPVCDDCLRDAIATMHENLGRSTTEAAITNELERRTVEVVGR